MNRLKNKKFWLLLGFSLILSACQTLPTQNIDPNVEDSTMQDTRKIIDSYQFFEKEGDLFFVLTLKNNSTETIEINPTITPFEIYRQYYEPIESRYIIPSPRPTPDMIVIAPKESHDFTFNISDEYEFKDGKNTYDFVYFYGKDYTYDEIVAYGYKNLARDLTIFSFTWFKEPNSIKGKLISYDIKNK